MQFYKNDTELIEAFRHAEGHAFEVVYERFASGLCLFVDQMIKNKQVAEDIAVEVLGKSFRRPDNFESFNKLKSFLFTSANNAALDYLKTQKRHDKAHQEIKYLQEYDMDDVELAYIRSEVIAAVEAAINALPRQPQQVIRMAFIEGKKLPEIAAELQLSYNTVQNHRARGIELMRVHLLKNKWLSAPVLWIALSLIDRN
ncbi:MAG: sigma-70 family RNA polymerase sigma factor [Chitinophagaceae bacterium]|nr:sigma-70 family RNA polymerase sigma factor [Chitinophagaceae bacterium]